jgi:DNA-binding NtrC family response regulator
VPTRSISVLYDAKGSPRALRVPAFSLRVTKGKDLRKERRFALHRVVVGSGPGTDFVLQDPTVSALHCELSAQPDGIVVKDLGSKNGTFLGEHRVTEAFVGDRDDLTLGETRLRFRLLDEADETPLSERSSFGRLVGSSARMRELYTVLEKASASDVSVLLQGPTGSGKELAAEALMQHGPRRNGPLVVIDCGALAPTLAESELFGHEQHAFTGATTARAGAFERATTGTVFLDEVGELPLELQPKLLGVLERRLVQRLGGNKPLGVDVRVIAATHRDLAREVNKGSFRSDLYFRLAVTEVRLPALSERREDVPQLIQHFLDQLAGPKSLPPHEFQRLCNQDYPGNVRQLRNEVERAALGLASLPATATPDLGAIELETPFRVQKERLIAGFERAYLDKLLAETGGNVTEAARRSGLSRVRLYEIMHRWQK